MTVMKIPGRGWRVALGLAFVLALVQVAAAADEYPATGYFLDNLTEESSWNEILRKPGMMGEFPFIAFGPTFVALPSVCLDGTMLAIADSRIDTGVRVSAGELRAQVESATRGWDTRSRGPVAAAGGSDAPTVGMRYPVWVYRLTERGVLRERLYLFEKLWTIPACPAK